MVVAALVVAVVALIVAMGAGLAARSAGDAAHIAHQLAVRPGPQGPKGDRGPTPSREAIELAVESVLARGTSQRRPGAR